MKKQTRKPKILPQNVKVHDDILKNHTSIPSDVIPYVQEMELRNSIFPSNNDMLAGVFSSLGGGGAELSQPWQTVNSNTAHLFTLDRPGLNYTYKTHGIMKKPIDVPVNDAFRGGIIVKSDQLSPEDIQMLYREMRIQGDIHQLKLALKWRRLFGGSGVIINVNERQDSDFDPESIQKGDALSFISADRWELTLGIINPNSMPVYPVNFEGTDEIPYNYYGIPFHKTRVLRMIGEEAPSMIRPQLQGWGMSSYESILRNLNMYVKDNQVLFKLLDEAKIDVLKLKNFNSAILAGLSQGKIDQRVQLAFYGKNYLNSLLLDSEDEYESKERSFSGFADIKNQIRIDMAAAIGMPMTKLFGLSASGFNSGEDDIEVYNGMVESEVREPGEDALHTMVPLRCRALFGFAPDDLYIGFHPLRVIGAVEEEAVKTSKQNRFFQISDHGFATPQETMEVLKEEELFVHDTAVLRGEEPLPPLGFGGDEEGDEPGDKKDKGKEKKK